MGETVWGVVGTRQCACCDVTLEALHIVTGQVYTRPFIDWRGKSFCKDCAGKMGFVFNHHLLIANKTQLVCRN